MWTQGEQRRGREEVRTNGTGRRGATAQETGGAQTGADGGPSTLADEERSGNGEPLAHEGTRGVRTTLEEGVAHDAYPQRLDSTNLDYASRRVNRKSVSGVKMNRGKQRKLWVLNGGGQHEAVRSRATEVEEDMHLRECVRSSGGAYGRDNGILRPMA